MDNSTKIQMMYESFDILKDSWETKNEAIKRLICKMFDVDSNAAVEMWNYIVKQNKNLLNDYHAYYLIEDIIEAILYGPNAGCYFTSYDNVNEGKLWPIVFSKKDLYETIYGHNRSLGDGCCYLVSHLMTSDDTQKLLEVLNLMYKNKGKGEDYSFGASLTKAIEHIQDDVIPAQNKELLEVMNALSEEAKNFIYGRK